MDMDRRCFLVVENKTGPNGVPLFFFRCQDTEVDIPAVVAQAAELLAPAVAIDLAPVPHPPMLPAKVRCGCGFSPRLLWAAK